MEGNSKFVRDYDRLAIVVAKLLERDLSSGDVITLQAATVVLLDYFSMCMELLGYDQRLAEKLLDARFPKAREVIDIINAGLRETEPPPPPSELN